MIHPWRLKTAAWGLLLLAILSIQSTTVAMDLPEKNAQDLGMTLKAAVASGAISTEDATLIWKVLSFETVAGTDKAAKQRSDKRVSGLGAFGLPRPGQLVVLRSPDLLPHDLLLLSTWLDLNADQEPIVDMLLNRYSTSWARITNPLDEAMARYQRSLRSQRLSDAVARIDEASLNPDASLLKLRNRIAKLRDTRQPNPGRNKAATIQAGDRKQALQLEKLEAYERRLTQAVEGLDERLEQLRVRINRHVSQQPPDGDSSAGDDLVRLAQSVETEKRALRQEFEELLSLVMVSETSEAAWVSLDAALTRLRLRRARTHARLAGEAIHIRTAWGDVKHTPDSTAVDEAIEASDPILAALGDRRVQASIDRELAGLRLMIALDQGLGAATEADQRHVWHTYVQALKVECDLAIALRDGQMFWTSLVADQAQQGDQAQRYGQELLNAAWRPAFPAEMATPWTLRAMTAALELEGLDRATHEQVRQLQQHASDQINHIRTQAIQERLMSDAQRGRAAVDRLNAIPDASFESLKLGLIPEDRTGFGYAERLAVDEATQINLRRLLTAEQFARLPHPATPKHRRLRGQEAKQVSGKGD